MNPTSKIIVWAFYGAGKSFAANGTSIVDLDSMHYRFTNVESNPHDSKSQKLTNGIRVERNPEYPQNYIQAVRDSDAAIVLVNCEIPVLEQFDNVVLFYPSLSLKQDFLERYQKRGDNPSFIHTLEQDFEMFIRSLGRLPYPKLVAHEHKKYVSDVLQGGKINMSQFLLKKDWIHLFDQAKNLNVLPSYIEPSLSSDEIAQKVFEGEISVNSEELQETIQKAEKALQKQRFEEEIERWTPYMGKYKYEDKNALKVVHLYQWWNDPNQPLVLNENDKNYNRVLILVDRNGQRNEENIQKFKTLLEQGFKKTNKNLEVGAFQKNSLDGFTHEEAVDLVQDAIACGVLILHHGQVQPYSYGFECQYPGKNTYIPDMDASPFDFPELIVRNIELNKIEHHAFVSSPIRYSNISLHQLKEEVDAKKEQLNDVSIVPYHTTKEYAEHERNQYVRGLIGNDRHIDAGYGVDGIIRGDCGGDYSSTTTGSQNDWMRAAVALRGFCLDYIHDCLTERRSFPYLQKIVEYYQSKGLDLTDKNQVIQWCKKHPNKCYSNKYQIKEMPNEEKPININTGKWTIEEKTVYLQALRNIQEIQDIAHTFILDHLGKHEGKELLEALQQTLKSIQAESRVNAIGEKEYIVDVDYGVLTGSFFIQQNGKVQLFEDFEIYDENGSYYGMCDKEQLEKVLQEHERELEKE